MRFSDFPLCAPVLRAVFDSGYETPSPIQAQAIPAVLEGNDVLGCAQTGTGKTAAFALPILHNLFANKKAKPTNKPRCLVLAPTRELAGQIAEGFQTYGKHLPVRGAVLFGGVNQNPQVKKLRRGIDVLIATPGRLLDLMNQGHVDLSKIEVLVLDEADRMLDMGFIHDIRKVVAKVPEDHQTLFFSATMPKEIKKLANQMLTDPVKIEIAPESPAALSQFLDSRFEARVPEDFRQGLSGCRGRLGQHPLSRGIQILNGPLSVQEEEPERAPCEDRLLHPLLLLNP